jgi:hypothetical protein
VLRCDFHDPATDVHGFGEPPSIWSSTTFHRFYSTTTFLRDLAGTTTALLSSNMGFHMHMPAMLTTLYSSILLLIKLSLVMFLGILWAEACGYTKMRSTSSSSPLSPTQPAALDDHTRAELARRISNRSTRTRSTRTSETIKVPLEELDGDVIRERSRSPAASHTSSSLLLRKEVLVGEERVRRSRARADSGVSLGRASRASKERSDVVAGEGKARSRRERSTSSSKGSKASRSGTLVEAWLQRQRERSLSRGAASRVAV